MREALYHLGKNIEARNYGINQQEKRLGITGPVSRLLEAAHFIDWNNLRGVLLIGQPNPERIYGHQEWGNHVNARLYSRSYSGPLTPEFIINLHSIYAQNAENWTGTEIANRLRTTTIPGGDRGLALQTGHIERLTAHPGISFVPHERFNGYPAYDLINNFHQSEHTDQGKVTGHILYRYDSGKPDMIMEDLERISDWYNDVVQREHNPYEVAALLQQQMMALHPFLDLNGRTTRNLMYRSEENCGFYSSILSHTDDDLFTTTAEWIEQVTQGSRRHKYYATKLKTMLAHGISESDIDLIDFFDLGQQKIRYDERLENISEKPPVIQPGEYIWVGKRYFIRELDPQFPDDLG